MTAPPSSDVQAAQSGLLILLEQDLQKAWGVLDIRDLRRTLPLFKTTVAALTRKYGSASAALSVRHYMSVRQAVGVRSPFSAQPSPYPPEKQVASVMDWATRDLWSFNDPKVESSQSAVLGSAEKLVMDVARDTVIKNVTADRQALGWARVTEPNPCYFCALLASRGAVYKTDAFKDKNSNFATHPDTPSDVKTHDHCRCHVEPVFVGDEFKPSDQVKEWQALYANTARMRGDKLKNFRRAYEGR